MTSPTAQASDAERPFATGPEVGARFKMEWHVSYGAIRPRIAILASRSAHCLLDLLWRCRSSELAVDVAIVISNHETLRTHVEPFDVPYAHLPVTAATRSQQEQQLLDLLRDRVDLVVLARYMQVLPPGFLDAYPHAVINIHHSFLPAFAGADPYGQAMTRGVKIIGATAHYATPYLDAGPIIEQDVARVSHTTPAPTSSGTDARSSVPCSRAPCAGTSRTACSCTTTRRWSFASGAWRARRRSADRRSGAALMHSRPRH